jgi:hypothetical protein
MQVRIKGFKTSAKDRVRRRSAWWAKGPKGGYVPWWNEYPGMHIPAPIEVGMASLTDMKARKNSYADQDELEFERRHFALPITVMFARRAGELMCEASFRFYN